MTFEILIHPKATRKINSLPANVKEHIKQKLKEFTQNLFAFDVKKLIDAGNTLNTD